MPRFRHVLRRYLPRRPRTPSSPPLSPSAQKQTPDESVVPMSGLVNGGSGRPALPRLNPLNLLNLLNLSCNGQDARCPSRRKEACPSTSAISCQKCRERHLFLKPAPRACPHTVHGVLRKARVPRLLARPGGVRRACDRPVCRRVVCLWLGAVAAPGVAVTRSAGFPARPTSNPMCNAKPIVGASQRWRRQANYQPPYTN